MNGLPDGWSEAALADIAEVRLGRQRSPKTHTGANMRPYLRAANVTWQGLALGDVKEMNFEPAEVETYRLIAGDVLVAEASGSRGEVGKPALWRAELDNCCFQNTLIRVRTKGPLPEYLLYFLKSEALAGRLGDAARGVGIHHIGAAGLSAYLVPVPPLGEQCRIVAAIEEHLSRLDEAEVSLWSAERRIRALEKAIITKASLTLTPLPHWKIVAVDHAGSVSLGLQRSPKRHTGHNMRPYLRVANVFEDRIDEGDVMSMDMTDAEWERYRLRDGDVLLNEGQSPELLGRPAIYRGQPPNVAFTNSLIRFQANEGIDPEWALLVFRSHMHNRRFMRESQITTNIAHLSAGRFKTVEFPVPPLDEQQTLVAAARAGLANCARLRAEVDVARRRSRTLRHSLLAAAFAGRLVACQEAGGGAVAGRKATTLPDDDVRTVEA